MKESYVLITPARNVEAYIEKTIQSVVRQTVLPKRWVIVSDASSDRTDEIASRYAQEYDFIQFIRIRDRAVKSFASKVKTFEAGYNQLVALDYDYIGNLDADLTFDKDYYATILKKFQENSKLGIAGGNRFAIHNRKCMREFSNPWSVCAGVQLFRRRCYEDIGGYVFVDRMEDCVAEVMARLRRWEVQSFDDVRVYHHRPVGEATVGALAVKFEYGVLEHSIGYHPLYEAAKFFHRLKEKPYLISSLLRIGGYMYAALLRKKRVIPYEVVLFMRAEQMHRLRSAVQLQFFPIQTNDKPYFKRLFRHLHG
ncbi:MAG: glycosyltransferase family A protein [bacterium]